MSSANGALTAGGQSVELEVRGDQRHDWTVIIQGTFTATLAIEVAGIGTTDYIELEQQTVQAVRNGYLVGGFLIRVRALSVTSGTVNVDLRAAGWRQDDG